MQKPIVRCSPLFLMFAAFFWAASLLLMGCSSSGTSAATPEPPAQPRLTVAEEAQRDQALQHFVDGSVYELKGEYAQAALEYQEALRYDKNHAVYFALSRVYGELGKNLPAIESGREAVRLQPDNVDYRRNLASVFLSATQTDSAIAQYEAIVRIDSSSLESWFNLARLYQLRSPAKGLVIYNRIVERFGPQWDVLLQMADLCSKLGKFDRAAWALKNMVDIDPGNKELRRTLAQTYVRAGELDNALLVYERLHEADPNDLDLLSEVAGVRLLKKDYAGADSAFNRILSADSINLEGKLHVGEVYFSTIEKDSTLVPRTKEIFERICAAKPEDWRAYWFLGALAAMKHDDSLAVRNFRKVTELASWNADAWVYLTSFFLNSNNYAEVARTLETAITVLPDDFRVNFFLGVAYNRLNRNIDAVRVLEHARSINPKDVDAIAQLALVYEALKKFVDSDSLYEEALRLDSANPVILNNYAYSLSERNIDLDRALTMVKKALEVSPETGSYLDTIGWIYYRLGRFSEAAENVKKAISKGEANAVVYEHLGDIYYRMNNIEGALEQWNLALQLDSTNAALRGKISRGSL